MSAPDLISGFYSTGGTILGIQILGYLYVPYPAGGIIMQDSAGNLHLLTMGTDGRLSSVPVTV